MDLNMTKPWEDKYPDKEKTKWKKSYKRRRYEDRLMKYNGHISIYAMNWNAGFPEGILF